MGIIDLINLQSRYVTETKPFQQICDLEISELFYSPPSEKFGSFVLNEHISEEQQLFYHSKLFC